MELDSCTCTLLTFIADLPPLHKHESNPTHCPWSVQKFTSSQENSLHCSPVYPTEQRQTLKSMQTPWSVQLLGQVATTLQSVPRIFKIFQID